MVRKLRVGGSQTQFDGSQTQRRFTNFAWQVRLGKGSFMAMCWLHSLHSPPIMPTGKAIVCMDIEEGKSMFEPFQISRHSKKEQLSLSWLLEYQRKQAEECLGTFSFLLTGRLNQTPSVESSTP